jgi:hypothetical protein
VANYPDQMFITIFGDLSWFRGDFNISYRFINLPGPDGNISSTKVLPPPSKIEKSQTLTITLIIAISSVLIVLMLTIIVVTCIVMKKRK